MTWAIVGGAAISTAGSIAGTPGAAEAVPFNTDTRLGYGQFDESSGFLNMDYGQRANVMEGAFGSLFNQSVRGGNLQEQQAIRQGQGLGGNDLASTYAGAQNQMMPGMAQAMTNRRMSEGMEQFGQMGQNLRGQAGEQQTMAKDLMGTNYADAQQQQLSLLRQQAAPEEERAGNSMMQRLFSMGQMGTEGGARNMEAFGEGQAKADLSRQLQSQQWGNQMQQQDRTMGMNMYGQAGQSMGQAGNMFNSGQQLNQQNYQNRMGYSSEAYNRAQQRMLNSQNMFGFGSKVRDNSINRMGAMQQGIMGLNKDLRATTDLARASAMPTKAGDSMMDGMMSGIGDIARGGGIGGALMGGGLTGGSLSGMVGGALGGLF